MPLDAKEQHVWDFCEAELLAERNQLLPVEEPVEDLAALLSAIYDAKARRQIDDETYEAANAFMAKLLEAPDISATISELRYEEGFNGLNLVVDNKAES